jgi:hypothetical protein
MRRDKAAQQSLEYGAENGPGGVFVGLTAERYRKLKE